ncbi:MAG: helix-turn-helix domain-containing protein [Oscillospiraceae bacterium]|nr:helix-turn-helix domain-containing protein [Oscillospiraceae bacterium]
MSKLYEAENHILLYTSHSDPAEHRHAAAHIIISMTGTMDVVTPAKTLSCRGVLLPSGIPHSVKTHGQPVLVFLYDCSCDTAVQITSLQEISPTVCEEIARQYLNFEAGDQTKEYKKFERALSALLALPPIPRRRKDARILSAMNYIRTHAAQKLSCAEVAQTVFLSPGRFSHLFKAQLGMTFAAYVVYQRILLAYAHVFRGSSITEAALEAGFSDGAHFADVNRRIFGASVSSITRDMTFTKIQ